MVSTLLFDIGNVVWRYQDKFHHLKHQWAKISGLTYDEFGDLYHSYYKNFEFGTHTLNDFIVSLNQSSNATLFTQALDQTYSHPDFDSYYYPQTLELISSLRQGYQVGYLSNAENFFYPYIQQKMESYFDFCHCSWQLGLRKPDPKIFQKVLDLHHLQASEVLFIDDMPKNIAGAQSVGLQTILFEDPTQLRSEIQKYVKI